MTNQVEVSAEIEKVLSWDLKVSRVPADVRVHSWRSSRSSRRPCPGIWRASQAAADVRDLYTSESQQELEELVAWASKEQQRCAREDSAVSEWIGIGQSWHALHGAA